MEISNFLTQNLYILSNFTKWTYPIFFLPKKLNIFGNFNNYVVKFVHPRHSSVIFSTCLLFSMYSFYKLMFENNLHQTQV
jgi:hypothetical protein